MLETEKLTRTFVLTLFFSFSIYMFTLLVTSFGIALSGLVIDTFLENFGTMIALIVHLLVVIVRYISLIFMVGAFISLLVIFIFDWLIKPTQKPFN